MHGVQCMCHIVFNLSVVFQLHSYGYGYDNCFFTGFSPSSLNQSLVSMDPAPLGSPLQSGSLINHPGNTYNMSMLAQSRLSQYGQPDVSINRVTLSL